MKTISYAKFQHRYGGLFIARMGPNVKASSRTYKGLVALLRKRQLDRKSLVVGFIPPEKSVCIYAAD